jgi:hypothetical protein
LADFDAKLNGFTLDMPQPTFQQLVSSRIEGSTML